MACQSPGSDSPPPVSLLLPWLGIFICFSLHKVLECGFTKTQGSKETEVRSCHTDTHSTSLIDAVICESSPSKNL